MPAETVPDHDIPGLGRSRLHDDAAVAELAERQHGVVARRQLARIGLGKGAVEHRLAVGRLHPVARGVYAVGYRRLSPRGRWMAAVLTCDRGAVLSHHSAAALWGLIASTQGLVEVTLPRKSTSSSQIKRHRSVLAPDEVTVHEGVPVTTVPRTLFDLAATSTTDRVENAIRQSEYLRLYDALSLVDMVSRYPGRRGAGRVRAALARIETLPQGRPRSPLEERFLPFLRRHGLPRPRLNEWIVAGSRRLQVDCHWPGTGQVVELDGWQAHGTRSAFREDRTRDRVLGAAGYSVTRISWAQLDDEPEAVASDLHELLAVPFQYKRM